MRAVSAWLIRHLVSGVAGSDHVGGVHSGEDARALGEPVRVVPVPFKGHALVARRGRGPRCCVFPQAPGKAIQLELKTTTVVGERHVVRVDLGRLWDYKERPPGQQPFYAFPRPRCRVHSSLRRSAQARKFPSRFSRSGASWWFAEQMIVLTTNQVCAVLARELAAHRSRRRNCKKALVTFDLAAGSSTPVVWGKNVKEPGYLRWREFWTVLEGCGQPEWPQIVQLPSRLVVGRERVAWRDLQALFGMSSKRSGAVGRVAEGYTVLTPDRSRDFRRMPTLWPEEHSDGVDRDEEVDLHDRGDRSENRVVVFLRGEALTTGR